MEAHISLGSHGPLPAALVRDEGLARLIGKGSERAFTALYQRYHQPLYRYCRSMLRDDADAQDALQSTFAGAFTALRDGRRDAPLRPWLFRIAHNEAISIIRGRRPQSELPDGLPTQGAGTEEQAEHHEQLRRLVADMRELPERQRAALLMRELSGLSHEEIALALETTVGTAKQTIFEARRALAELEEGRMTSCDEICRTISNGDRRALRGRKLRAHLRECRPCAAFAAAIPARSGDLRALAPALPSALTGTLLTRALSGSGSGSGGSGPLGGSGGSGALGGSGASGALGGSGTGAGAGGSGALGASGAGAGGSGLLGASAAGKAALALSGAKLATTVALVATGTLGAAAVLTPGHPAAMHLPARPAGARTVAPPADASGRSHAGATVTGAATTTSLRKATQSPYSSPTGAAPPAPGSAGKPRGAKSAAAASRHTRSAGHAAGAAAAGPHTASAAAPSATGASHGLQANRSDGRSSHAQGAGAGAGAGAGHRDVAAASHTNGHQRAAGHGSSSAHADASNGAGHSSVPKVPNLGGAAIEHASSVGLAHRAKVPPDLHSAPA